jgi:1-acyl-sn-glycerol-3-phosphate acyltransferase
MTRGTDRPPPGPGPSGDPKQASHAISHAGAPGEDPGDPVDRPVAAGEGPGRSLDTAGVPGEVPGGSVGRPVVAGEGPAGFLDTAGVPGEVPGGSVGRPGAAGERPGGSAGQVGADREDPGGLVGVAGGGGPGGSVGEAAGSGGESRGSGGGRGVPNPDRGYVIAGALVKPLMRAWFRIRLEGGEHIPSRGPVILASNHRSNMDPVLLASAVERPVAFMAKAELFVGPLGWVLRWIGQFPVRRGGIDREALRRVNAVLARGSMLGLFPEGTRGDGSFAAVHPGLAYIVVRQRCPVVPVAIFGTERVRRRFGWLPLASPVRIVVGPPIDLPDSTGDRAGRRAASEVLRQRLQAFLVVAGDPPPDHAAKKRSSDE